MFCSSNVLSERTRRALLILCALSVECWRNGDGIGKKELERIAGIPAIALAHHLEILLALGLVKFDSQKLYPGEKLFQTSLYDFIVRINGRYHVDETNIGEISTEASLNAHIHRCEDTIRERIGEYLKSINLLSMLPECGNGLMDSIIRQFATGIDMRAQETRTDNNDKINSIIGNI